MSWPLAKFEEVALPEKGAIVSGPFGSNIGSRFFVDEGVPVIRGNNLTFGQRRFIDDGFVYLTEEKAQEFRNCQAIEGDLVFTAAGTIGQVGIIPPDTRFERYIISNKQLRVRCDKNKVIPLFLFLWFTTREMRQHIINKNSGSTIPLINLGILRGLPVPLPPLDVQREITATLSAYDDLIENNRRRMALLDESVRLLYREWFVRLRFPGHEHTRITDGVPEGWERKTALEAVSVLSGGTPKTSVPDYWDGEIPFYTPKDATDGIWVTNCERTVTELGLQNCNSKLYPRETVFISARGTVGKLNMTQRSMVMSQSCYALVGKDHLPQPFVYAAMQAAVDALRQQAVGAVFDAIVVDTFKRINLLIPSPVMLRLFDETIRPIFEQVENLTLQNQKLRTARDLLLPRLMSGELLA
ncbi:MAG: restriction endonuclease subunit S [Thiobacillus sp.]